MERLKQLRESRKLSQLRLGMLIDVVQETISGYEIGRSEPDLTTLCKLADIFGVSVDYLLGRTNVKAVICTSELTPRETELLTSFRSLPESKKERALGMLEGLM